METLPKWGMTADGELSALPTPELRTREKGCGLLPTPVKADATAGGVIGKNDRFIQTKTGSLRKINQNGKDGSVGLARLVKMWPTPRKSDGSGAASARIKAAHGIGDKRFQLREAVYETPEKSGGALNPTWVEWLMGWPRGWSDLKPLETGKSLTQWLSHGKRSGAA